jgi:hypothetical protein
MQTIGFKSFPARLEIVENKAGANTAEATKAADEVIDLMRIALTSTKKTRKESYDQLFKIVVDKFETLDYKEKKSREMTPTLQKAIVLLTISKKSRQEISDDTASYMDDIFQYRNIINTYDVVSTLFDLENYSTDQIKQTLSDYKSIYEGYRECGLQVLTGRLIHYYAVNIKGTGFCFASGDETTTDGPEFFSDMQVAIKNELPFASKGYIAFSITNKFHNELHEKFCSSKLTVSYAGGMRFQEIFSKHTSLRKDEWRLLYQQNLNYFFHIERSFGPITRQKIKNKEITFEQAHDNLTLVKERERPSFRGREGEVYIKYLADSSITKDDLSMIFGKLENEYIQSYIDINQLTIIEGINLTSDEESILTNPVLHKNILDGSITIKQIFKLKELILTLLKESDFRIQQFQNSLEENTNNIPPDVFDCGHFLERKKNEEKIVLGEKVLVLIKNKVECDYWF